MRKVFTSFIVSLLLVSCSSPVLVPPVPEPQQPPIVAPAPPSTKEPGQPAPPSTPAEEPLPPLPSALVERAGGALERITFTDGDTISEKGVYFLQTETGTGEAWVYRGESYFFGVQAMSADNCFVITWSEEGGQIVDRADGSVWQWDPARVRPLLADSVGSVFALVDRGRDTGQYIWAGPSFEPRQVFTLAGGGRTGSALLAPDGRHLALVSSLSAPDRQELVVLDLATSKAKSVALPQVGGATLRLYDDGFELEQLVLGGNSSRPTWSTAIQRVNWQGEPLGSLSIPGRYLFFSPDGRWAAWEEEIGGGMATATVIADAVSLEPRLRAVGTTPCFQAMGHGGTRWLSDSTGLVVGSAAGYRLLTLSGALEDRPFFEDLIWKDEPQPAPDKPDRWALGRVGVVENAGPLVGVTLSGAVPANWSPWGETSAELRFVLPAKPGGGACDERPPMPSLVLLPAEPLPEFPLVLRATDVCTNLRDRPHSSGRVVACLPSGTALSSTLVGAYDSTYAWSDGTWWLSVVTPQGERGWVQPAVVGWAAKPGQ
jgi:hypothetical protein